MGCVCCLNHFALMALIQRIHSECIEWPGVLIELDKEPLVKEKKDRMQSYSHQCQGGSGSACWSFIQQPFLFNINYCSFHTLGPFTLHICLLSVPFPSLLVRWGNPSSLNKRLNEVSPDGQQIKTFISSSGQKCNSYFSNEYDVWQTHSSDTGGKKDMVSLSH